MLSTWSSVILMLVASVNGARNDSVQTEDDSELPCASIQTSSSVVLLGSPVKATCIVRDSCALATGEDVHIKWHLDNRLLPSRLVSSDVGWASEVVIPSFNLTRASLSCSVQASPDQVVGGVEITAGYPPGAPQNLSCQTSLTPSITLTCIWAPWQQETYLLTNYTLHTTIRQSGKNQTYKLLSGVHRYVIPRPGYVLYSKMYIYVKAVNELGEASSVPLTLEPISAVKLSPPVIQMVVSKTLRCLNLTWSLSEQEVWMCIYHLNVEVRLKTANSSHWPEKPILRKKIKDTRTVDLCRLLHWTQYVVQMRVRYKQNTWSEWSGSQSGVTLETAPTGRLDWWMKVSGDHVNKNVHLFWKPSKQFLANGHNVSYVVSFQKLPGEEQNVCSTKGNCCTFPFPRRAKKVYLRAVNAAGISNPTEIQIHLPKARTGISDVSAIPHDDRSLLVQWKIVASSSPADFIVEWRPLSKKDLSPTQFEIAERSQTSLVIKGGFELYKPYGISVYPRFKDGIGRPQTVNAYWRQKAPSMVPKLQIKKTWKSHVELTWDEIPLDQRNGIIQSYTIFYWYEDGPINVVNVDPEERRLALKDLQPACLYEAFMMVSTSGGSLNGSTVHFEIKPFDGVSVAIIITISGVGLSLLFICIVMPCFCNQRRLKGRIWPIVPDPANSSIKRWTSDSTQDTHLASGSEEPSPMYLSHLSFLDLPLKLSKEDDNLWLSNAEDTSDLGESICGTPFIPGYSGSNSGSVPYATVIFSGACNSPPAKAPNVYLRSESTQPLLETEESSSPRCYQNVATDVMPVGQCFFGACYDCVPEEAEDPVALWDDFPFLQALAMNDSQND